jgi:head-tail adaptor
MLDASAYRFQVRVERRLETDDGYGNVRGAWTALVTRRAAYKPATGRELLAAGTLESTTSGVLTLRADPETIAITAADRVVFLVAPYAPSIAQIRVVTPRPDNAEIEFMLDLDAPT